MARDPPKWSSNQDQSLDLNLGTTLLTARTNSGPHMKRLMIINIVTNMNKNRLSSRQRLFRRHRRAKMNGKASLGQSSYLMGLQNINATGEQWTRVLGSTVVIPQRNNSLSGT